VCDVSLQTEDDNAKVFGETSEIRGGLFKFIDDVNNERRAARRSCGTRPLPPFASSSAASPQEPLAVVLAKASEVGTFMLRELLESADMSRTHRLAVSKQRLVFLVSLNDGCNVTPQLQSRAHTLVLLD